MYENSYMKFSSVLRQHPHAVARVAGSEDYSSIRGEVRFYQMQHGVLVVAEIMGLPAPEGKCGSPVFGFHIHAGNECAGNNDDPFADAMTHYNPGDCPHPYHAGDLPPLFGNKGYAFMAVLTDRFSLHEILGKTVIIHSHPDDFTTQPAGNSGMKIACGKIVFVANISSLNLPQR